MKNKIVLCILVVFTIALLGAALTFPKAAGAANDSAALIEQLQKQIKELQAQIIELKAQLETAKTEIKLLTKILQKGAT